MTDKDDEEAEMAASLAKKQESIWRILPFILNALAAFIVKKSYVYSDEIFLLLLITALVLFLISVFVYVAQYLNGYVVAYEFGTIKFLLSLIIPYYALDIFETGFSQAPTPRWYEAIAYLSIMIVIVLSFISLFTNEFKAKLKEKKNL
jgi:hypothetical protein